MENLISRRSFLGTAAVSMGALSLSPSIGYAKNSKAFKVVVVGGGYGGSTAAKFMKLLRPDVEVTLIDRNKVHTSCAVSSEVIFGMAPDNKILMDHSVLVNKYGVKFVQAEVTGLDGKKKFVKTTAGNIPYDKLIVSPGIGYDYDEANGFDAKAREDMVAAWIAGPETFKLQKQLRALKKGGTIIMRIPTALYRCPPGPYERASLFGDYAKKIGGKVIILDSNPGIVSKAPLFKAGFEELYKDVLEYIPNTKVKSYDKGKRTLVTDKGNFTADLINFVPDQKASETAFLLGLVKDGDRWAAVSPKSFESMLVKDVYVIGDAINTSEITNMPKSGVVANGTAKFVVDNIARELAGKEPLTPILGNSCYSMVSPEEAIWIATVYEYDPKKNWVGTRDGANSIPLKRSHENRVNLESWTVNMLLDTFG